MAISAAEMALNCLGQIVLIMDQHGQVHFSSVAARKLFEEGRLSLRNGVLQASVASESMSISAWIAGRARVALAQGGMLFRRLGQSSNSLQLAVVKLEVQAGVGQRFYAILISDHRKAPVPDVALLKAQFGLTAAQSALAVEIVQGHTLKACAQRLGISQNTARTHLSRIFEKTDTKRQAELVRLISLLYPVCWPVAHAGRAIPIRP
jgi:DNA-binding CsgD family transcriptional regulator